MTVYALTINGAATEIEDAWNITAPSNGSATLTCQLAIDDPADIPGFDDEIVLTEDGEPIFGGNVTSALSGGIVGEPTVALYVRVTALDFNEVSSRRYIGFPGLAAGITLKQALEAIVPYLHGVTLDPAQVTGPTLEAAVEIHSWLARQALDYLTTATGYLWRIVPAGKLLSMYAPGSLSAPFTIVDDDGMIDGDLTVQPKREGYANRVFVVAAPGIFTTAEDAGEIAVHGPWEFLAESPDTTDQGSCNALAAAILTAKLPTLKEITYQTLQRGLEPGQTQSIQSSLRGINNTYLITEVNTNYIGGVAVRRVRAIEGLVYKVGWREQTRSLFSGGGGSSTTLPGIGGGGVTAAVRFFYFLGGSGTDFVMSPTPTWVDASPMKVQVNTVPRGTTSAQVTAQLKALDAGVSVQARIFDVTDNVACTGLSAVITDTDWQTVTWTVALTPGSHFYKLQLLPGSVDAPVGAMSYLE